MKLRVTTKYVYVRLEELPTEYQLKAINLLAKGKDHYYICGDRLLVESGTGHKYLCMECPIKQTFRL